MNYSLSSAFALTVPANQKEPFNTKSGS